MTITEALETGALGCANDPHDPANKEGHGLAAVAGYLQRRGRRNGMGGHQSAHMDKDEWLTPPDGAYHWAKAVVYIRFPDEDKIV